jgi:hypothetical protein
LPLFSRRSLTPILNYSDVRDKYKYLPKLLSPYIVMPWEIPNMVVKDFEAMLPVGHPKYVYPLKNT